jgi:hypothetical protein
MPLIDADMIDSLQLPDGTHSRLSLYLLGAVGKGPDLTPPPADWRDRVMVTKISKSTLVAIRSEAKRLRALRYA